MFTMRDILAIVLSILSGTLAHHEVHLVPAKYICPNVSSEYNILLPSPEDCSVYYKCEDGMALPQSCPPGLHWCQVTLNCTLPLLANCTIGHTIVTYSPVELLTYSPNVTSTPGTTTNPGGICPIDGALLPDPTNCQNYYECQNNEPVSKQCPSGEEYSCWNQRCESTTSAKCITSTETGDQCNTNNSTLPNIDDCSKYYKCVNGVVQSEECPSDLFFNAWSGECVDETQAHCDSSTITSTTDSGTTTEPTIETTKKPPSIFCPAGSDGIKYPDFNGDCSAYMECDNGQPKKIKCDPPTFNYNCETKKCENITHCCAPQTKPPTTETTPGITETTTSSATNPGGICPIDGALLPDPTNCQNYYECQNNEPVRKQCPSGEEYSCWNQRCESATSAKCITSTETGDQCNTNNSKLPNIDDCSKYYECVNGVVQSKECPSNLFFNAWSGECVDEAQAHCESTVTSTPELSTTTEPNSNASESTINTNPGSVDTTTSTGTTISTETTTDSIDTTTSTGTTISSETTTGSIDSTTSTGTTISSETTTGSIDTTTSTGTTISTETTTDSIDSTTSTGTTISSETTTGSIDSTTSTGTTISSETTTGSIDTTTSTGTTISSETTTGSIDSTTSTGTTISSETTPGTTETPPESSETTTSTETNSSSTETTTTTSEITSITTENTTEVDSPSPVFDLCPSDGAKIPNAIDCTSYYVCENHQAVPQKCPDGQEYSCWDQMCKKPTDAICIKEGIQQGHSCSNEGETNAILNDCSEYYKCSGGKIEIVKCASGTLYNKWFKACYNESLAWCVAYPVITPNTTVQPPPSTSKPSEKNNICPIAGARLPNILDCNSYYICINEEPVLETCPNGQGYSCWDQECLPESEAHCLTVGTNPGENCTIDGLQLPNIDDCTGYYECRNGSVVAVTCKAGLMYNAWFGKCVEDKYAHCQTLPTTGSTPTSVTTPVSPGPGVCPTDGAQLPNPTDCTAYYICKNNHPVPHKCPSGEEYSCWDQKCEKPSANSTCIKQGSQEGHHCSIEGEMMPNIADCGSYYKCIHGKVEIQLCAAGSIYTSWFKACLGISIGFCITFPTIPTISIPTTTTTISPSKDHDVCPIEHALLPNPVDCSTYYECIDNTPILQNCPIGMQYSCWDQKCENATEATCISSGIHVGDSCSNSKIKIKDIEDCGRYYQCVLGKVIKRSCLLGTQFNDRFQKCVKSEDAHCQTYPTVTTPKPTSSTPSVTPDSHKDLCPHDDILLPNPVNCSTYYRCINETPTLQLCGSGLEYSCWEMQCLPSSQANCIAVGSQEGQRCFNDGQTMQDPKDCHSYYKCENGIVTAKKCSFNGYYNKWFHICVPLAVLAHCDKISTTTTTTTPKTTTPSVDSSHDICPIDGATIPNPTDCSGYYKCVDTKPTPKKCPEGEEYSCWDQTCMSKRNSKCISVGSQQGLECSREGVRLQNVESCDSYFECNNGKVSKKYCFLGFEYNRWYQKCVFASYSHCKKSPTIAVPTTTQVSTTKRYPGSHCPTNGGTVPNPNDCQTYFVCNNSEPILYSCPPGQNYDCWNQRCEPAILARCINVPTAFVGQACTTEGETLPKVSNCREYYQCTNGKIEEKKCSLFHQYSVWGKKCKLIGLAKCANDKFLGIL